MALLNDTRMNDTIVQEQEVRTRRKCLAFELTKAHRYFPPKLIVSIQNKQSQTRFPARAVIT
mgnify:FL=1